MKISMKKTSFPAESFTLADDSVIAFLTHRDAGSMKINKENPGGLETRQKLFDHIDLSNDDVVSAGLVHGGDVAMAHSGERGTIIPQVDALVTNEPEVYISITVADCLPVFFFSPDVRAVGIAHAGWKPLREGVIEHTIEKLRNTYHADPARMRVAIGPGIGKCHFDVGQEVVSAFSPYLDTALLSRDGRTYIDLPEIVRRKIADYGVSHEHIQSSGACTYCEDSRYFSYRRDHEPILSTMLALIGMRQKM